MIFPFQIELAVTSLPSCSSTESCMGKEWFVPSLSDQLLLVQLLSKAHQAPQHVAVVYWLESSSNDIMS